MSGIYIKGMEMPKEPIAIIIYPDGKVFRVSYPEQIAEAVPVPPHGKLGDLDALRAYVDDYYKTHISLEASALMVALDRIAPTIIPAEESFEDAKIQSVFLQNWHEEGET